MRENQTIEDLGKAGGIQVFESPDFGKIRVAGTPEKPMFCLADICKVLGIGTPTNVKSRLSDTGVDSINVRVQTPTGGFCEKPFSFIDEPNLYRCIFQSRKEEAARFQDWVFAEILPTVRRNGVYATEEALERLLSNPESAIRVFTALKEERERNRMLSEQNEKLQLKASFVDTVFQSSDTYTFQQVAKDAGFRGANALCRMLVAKKIVFKQSGTYMPYAKYADKGYFRTRTTHYTHSDGSVGTNAYTVLTEKGRLWVHWMKETGRLS